MSSTFVRKGWSWLLAGVIALVSFSLSACGPNALNASPAQSATLADLRGRVEIYAQDQWQSAKAGDTVFIGQRVRTHDLSSVTLLFYDGSQAELGPQAEVAIDKLDAQTTGPRVIQLSQVSGESRHTVAKSSDPTSQYEVTTEAGTGRATGTVFVVVVWPKEKSQFWVEEGIINVINMEQTVVVAAGQLTIVPIGTPPTPAVFRITGEGEVTQMGSTWQIAGQTFATDASTIIRGNPQVGDWVTVVGHLSAGGAQTADIIALATPNPASTFNFIGTVEAVAAEQWTIAGQAIKVDAQTHIGAGLAVGDLVEVAGTVTQGGALVATTIDRALENPLSFSFTGIAETIGNEAWTISGVEVTVDLSTTIEGTLAAGDLVAVRGTILPDGTWLALSIAPATPNGRFKLTGLVETVAPWQVAGVTFEVDGGTDIDEEVVVGDMVMVSGIVQADGTWLAGRIMRLDPTHRLSFQFIGLVTRTRPWTVRGLPITVNDATVIKGNPKAGEMAMVKGWILEDGTWLATEIKRTGWHNGQRGCFLTAAIVRSARADRLVLLNNDTVWLTNAEIVGTPQEASIIWYERCIDAHGAVFTISIIVIYQLDALPVIEIIIIDNGNNTLPANCKVSKKGHIKCSKK